MVRKIIVLIISCFSIISGSAFAQANLVPSKRYDAGDAIYAPKAGVNSKIPEGWMGMLPRDTELFLLMPLDGSNGEIYISAVEQISPEKRKSNWLAGMALGNGNVIRSDGNIFSRGESQASNIIADQKTSDQKGYIETVCGPYGVCVSATLFGAPQDFEKMQQSLYFFIDNIKWVEPAEGGNYADFNWKLFLTGKHLLNYDYVPNAKAENDLWLCSDGSFTTKLKRSGLLKDQAKEYKGSKSGTWETSSIGEKGILVLNYQKLDPLKVTLEIKDEMIFLNGKRHFVMKSTVCK